MPTLVWAVATGPSSTAVTWTVKLPTTAESTPSLPRELVTPPLSFTVTVRVAVPLAFGAGVKLSAPAASTVGVPTKRLVPPTKVTPLTPTE